MNSGKSIFAQLMDFLPSKAFRRCVKRYQRYRCATPTRVETERSGASGRLINPPPLH
jgi:hypothetical protein